MNILFVIKKEVYSGQAPLGILYLSSFLKGHGHSVFISDFSYRGIERIIREKNINALAISCMNTNYNAYLCLSEKVKTRFPNILIVWGGPTPTYNPDEVIKQGPIDIICRGEGELALLELAERFDLRQNLDKIPNLWIKNGAMIHKNGVAPLVNLDSLPFPDWPLTGNFLQFKYSPIKSIIASRGCPFDCSFCYNTGFKELYKDKGKLIRIRNVDNVILELEELKARYNARFFYFLDDTFPHQHNWLDDFSQKYGHKIKTPFAVGISASFIDEKVAYYLKRAGCASINLAIECGNETIRRGILNKNITDAQIIKAARIVKESGLGLGTYNIIGIPYSTFKDELKTLDLNLKLKVDESHVTFCTPFSNTRLGKIAKEAGLIPDNIQITTWFNALPIKVANKERLEKFAYFFPILIAFPFLRSYLSILLKMPIPKTLLKLTGAIVHGYRIKRKIVPLKPNPISAIVMAIFFLRKRFST